MRSFTLLFFVFFLFVSCQEKEEKPEELAEAKQEMPAEDPELKVFRQNVETAKQFIDAFIAKDTARMAQFVTDDFIWSPPSVGRDSLSRSEWINAMQGYMDAYNDISLDDPQFYAGLDEDQTPNGDVRVYGLWESKHASSGKDSKLKWYAVMFFNDEGKLVHQAEWYDTADLQKEF